MRRMLQDRLYAQRNKSQQIVSKVDEMRVKWSHGVWLRKLMPATLSMNNNVNMP